MIDILSWLRLGAKDGELFLFTFSSAPLRPWLLQSTLSLSLGPQERVNGLQLTTTYFDEWSDQ